MIVRGRSRRIVVGLIAAVAAAGCRSRGAIGDGANAGAGRDVLGVELCWCPPGRFVMGSPASEAGRRDDETQVEVTLSRGFWMAKYETTQGEWRRFMGELHGTQLVGKGDEFPVYWVSYSDAEEFCRVLTGRARAAGAITDEWEFRLPTEAQWEYACRAGTTTPFSFGEALTLEQANFGRWKQGMDESPTPSAEPVGRYPANAWGLHDMHGNEFEWCRDWYHRRLPGGVDPDLSEVKGDRNRDGTFSRCRRGGAWTDETWACRSAFRLRFEPERSANHIGFRVALVRR